MTTTEPDRLGLLVAKMLRRLDPDYNWSDRDRELAGYFIDQFIMHDLTDSPWPFDNFIADGTGWFGVTGRTLWPIANTIGIGLAEPEFGRGGLRIYLRCRIAEDCGHRGTWYVTLNPNHHAVVWRDGVMYVSGIDPYGFIEGMVGDAVNPCG